MTTLAAVALLVALLQDKPPVTLTPDAPTDTVWPISGKTNRPNGTVLKVSAIRIERRWDRAADRFRELIVPESRLSRRSEVDGRAFKANLKIGPAGLYELVVSEGEQRLHAERCLQLGRPSALFASTRTSVARLLELCDRAAAGLEEIEKVATGKQPGSAEARQAFIKRIHADEQLLQDIAAKSDLTGSSALLNEICAHIRNAQVWELTGKATDEELNDGQAGGRDIFLDPALNFKTLRSTIEAARTVIVREASLSAATILDVLFARAEEKPDRLLAKAKDASSEALKLQAGLPGEDKDARAVFEVAERTDAPAVPEVRKALQDIRAKHLAER